MFMFVKIVGMSSGIKEKDFMYNCVSHIRENKQQSFQDIILSFTCENPDCTNEDSSKFVFGAYFQEYAPKHGRNCSVRYLKGWDKGF